METITETVASVHGLYGAEEISDGERGHFDGQEAR